MKTAEDYHELAKERGMVFVGQVPTLTTTKTLWQCHHCGRAYDRSYKQMRQIPHCRCQGEKAVSIDQYRLLAKALGIEWAGAQIPLTTTESTQWKSGQQIFEAPYSALCRPVIPRRYREYLPDYEAPPSNYSSALHSYLIQRRRK